MTENNEPNLKQNYLSAMREGSGRMADKVVQTALDQHVTSNDIYLDIFQDTAYEIGRLWQRNEFSVAQEHLATAIIERQMGDLHQYFKPVAPVQKSWSLAVSIKNSIEWASAW
jgi:MerR family transcriptional regulator, light-induced transcriptional regulator